MTLFARLAVGALFAAAEAAASTPVDVAAADNAFGFRLLNAVQDTVPGGNVVLSPVSAALDLSVVLNAAAGPTREQMLVALSLGGSEPEAVNTANAQLIKTLATPATDITLSLAESLWIDNRRATLLQEYVTQTKAWSDASITDLDFSSRVATARINGWASDATHGRIPHIIERIDPAEFAILLNAVYFKGEWTRHFDKAQTQPHEFTLAGGAVKQVPRMTQAGRFEYFETPAMQAIRLSFGTGDLVMEVLLPARKSSLRAVEADLTPEHWTEWKTRYTARTGILELPRFELSSTYRLNGPLHALGMVRIFQPKEAQITGMFSPAAGGQTPHVYIGSVLQSTYWKVDEEGAEAAAVTSIGVRASAMARPPEPFHMIVDRPFFCAIEDQRSGVLLFVGAIYDPHGGLN